MSALMFFQKPAAHKLGKIRPEADAGVATCLFGGGLQLLETQGASPSMRPKQKKKSKASSVSLRLERESFFFDS